MQRMFGRLRNLAEEKESEQPPTIELQLNDAQL